MKKRVFLRAYFRKNLGDDLFVDHIVNRYPHVSFKAMIPQAYATPFCTLRNLQPFGPFILFCDRVAYKILKRDVFRPLLSRFFHASVYIGGSIFMEPADFCEKQKTIPYKNSYILGANFGPYRTDAYYSYVKEQIADTEFTCFRDEYSYRLFSELPNVSMAPDILFAYKSYPAYSKGEGIGISVIDLRSRPGLSYLADMYYETIAKIVDLCKMQNIEVTLFGFCKDENDSKAIEEILSKTENKNVLVEQYSGDYKYFLDRFNNCEYILATRFHAMIIGWRLNKKVFPIVYSNKMKQVLKDINYDGDSWTLYENQIYQAEDLLRACMSTEKLKNLDEYIRNAEQHFQELDKFLCSQKNVSHGV